MIGYVKDFDSNKTISFKASYKKLLKKYTKIWKKIQQVNEHKKLKLNLFMVIIINM